MPVLCRMLPIFIFIHLFVLVFRIVVDSILVVCSFMGNYLSVDCCHFVYFYFFSTLAAENYSLLTQFITIIQNMLHFSMMHDPSLIYFYTIHT